MPHVRNDAHAPTSVRNLDRMMRLPRSLAFVFVAAGVAIACSSSDNKATGGSSGTVGGNSSSGNNGRRAAAAAARSKCRAAARARKRAAARSASRRPTARAASAIRPASARRPHRFRRARRTARRTARRRTSTAAATRLRSAMTPRAAARQRTARAASARPRARRRRATDKVQNGDETDVDCGGTTTKAPACATGLKCKVHADCASDGCDDTNKCALERSCTQTNGGTTCGSGEVGDPAAVHESCCISLPIPGSTTRLDKYKITSGRMRAFIERTQGNVQGWYTGAEATPSAAQIAQIDPVPTRLPKDLDSSGGANNGDGSDGQSRRREVPSLGATDLSTPIARATNRAVTPARPTTKPTARTRIGPVRTKAKIAASIRPCSIRSRSTA